MLWLDPPAKRDCTMSNKLIIAEQEIAINKDGMYCLNHLHKAAMANGKATESQRPSAFLSSESASRFVEALDLEAGFPASVITVKGGRSGTYAVELVAMKYAGWIEPSYEVQVYKAVQALKRGDIEMASALADSKAAAVALENLRRTRAIAQQVKNVKSVLELFPSLGDVPKQAIAAKMMNQAAGEELIPLPRIEGNFYTTTEIADELESTPTMIGRLANSHNIRTLEHGEWRLSQATHSAKQVKQWYWNDAGREAVRHVIELARS